MCLCVYVGREGRRLEETHEGKNVVPLTGTVVYGLVLSFTSFRRGREDGRIVENSLRKSECSLGLYKRQR